MRVLLLVIGLLFCVCGSSHARNYFYASPVTRSLGLSGAGDTTAWAFFANPAGLASIASYVAGCGYQNSFSLKELSTQSAFSVLPFRLVNTGIGYSRYGHELFNIQHLSGAFARSLSPDLHMGLRIEYVFRYVRGAETKGTFLVDAGFRYAVSEKTELAVLARNPAQSEIADDYSPQPLPSLLGVSYSVKLTPEFFVTADLSHRADIQQQVYAFGLSSQVLNQVWLRGVVSAKPVRIGVGAGINFSDFNFNISVNHHHHLGMSATAGLIYKFGTHNTNKK